MVPQYDLNKAISILKGQGIEVGRAVVLHDQSDFAMPVLDYLLTGSQLIQLMNENKLTEPGIREFAASFKKAATA